MALGAATCVDADPAVVGPLLPATSANERDARTAGSRPGDAAVLAVARKSALDAGITGPAGCVGCRLGVRCWAALPLATDSTAPPELCGCKFGGSGPMAAWLLLLLRVVGPGASFVSTAAGLRLPSVFCSRDATICTSVSVSLRSGLGSLTFFKFVVAVFRIVCCCKFNKTCRQSWR